MEFNGKYFNELIKEEFSDDMTFLMDYLKTEEQKREFIKTYMYILSTGMGDGITESEQYQLNEGLGGLFTFFKGRKLIGKYFDGLLSAADQFIEMGKKIDKDRDSGGENIAKKRESAEKTYNDTIKRLEGINKEIETLKQDSDMLAAFYKIANLKYKAKLFVTGKKSKVSMAKIKGYSDNIDDIKKEMAETERENQEQLEKEKELGAKIKKNPKASALLDELTSIAKEKKSYKERLKGMSEDDPKYALVKNKLAKLEQDEKDKSKEFTKEMGIEDPDEEKETNIETNAETDNTKEPAEVEADQAENDAEKAKADQEKAEKDKEEANKKLEKDIDRLEKYIQKIKENIKKKKEELKDEKDEDKKSMLQDAINQLSSGLTDKESKLKTLWDKLGESYIIPLSVFYEISLLESELLDMLHNLNENA